MTTKTLNISIPQDMADFLDKNPDLSPSKLLQGTIQNIQNTLNCNPQLIEANKKIERLEKFSQRIQNDLIKATDFITNKDLWGEFSK